MKKSFKVGICALAIILTVSVFTGCGSKNAVVGKWQDASGGTMQFLSDGTFTSSGLIGTSGEYSFPDSSHIKFEFSGLLSVAGAQVYEYSVSGNKLVLKDSYGTTSELTKS